MSCRPEELQKRASFIGFSQIEKSFQNPNSALSCILKLCYVNLNSLYDEENNFESSYCDIGKEKNHHYNISEASIFPEEVLHMIWEELLDLEEFDEGSIFNLCRLTKRPLWKSVMSWEERNDMVERARIKRKSKDNATFFMRDKYEDKNLIRKCIVQYIQEQLEKAELITTIDESQEELGLDTDSIKSGKSRRFIKFDISLCLTCGIYYLDAAKNDSNSYNEESMFNVLDSAVVNSCFKKYFHYHYGSGERDPATDYALKMLPYHLIKCGRFDEAVDLLSSLEFIQKRSDYLEIRMTANLHAKDCVLLKISMNKAHKDNTNFTIVSLFQKMKTYLKNENSLDVVDIGHCLFTYALKMEELGWIAEACEFYDAALDYQMYAGMYHMDVAPTLRRLGKCYVRLKYYGDAVRCFERALNTEKRYHGNYDKSVAETCELLAAAYMFMKFYSHALSSYEELLIVKEKLLGPNSLEVGSVRKELGYLNYLLENYETSLVHYGAALEISKNSQASDNVFNTTLYFWLGNTHSKLGNHKLAIKFFDDTLKSRYKCHGNTHKDIAFIFEAKGNAHQELGEVAIAISCFKRASIMSKNYHGGSSSNDIRILHKLADALKSNKQVKEALDIYRQMLLICKSGSSAGTKTEASILKSLTEIYGISEEADKAYECYLEIRQGCEEQKQSSSVSLT